MGESASAGGAQSQRSIWPTPTAIARLDTAIAMSEVSVLYYTHPSVGLSGLFSHFIYAHGREKRASRKSIRWECEMREKVFFVTACSPPFPGSRTEITPLLEAIFACICRSVQYGHVARRPPAGPRTRVLSLFDIEPVPVPERRPCRACRVCCCVHSTVLPNTELPYGKESAMHFLILRGFTLYL